MTELGDLYQRASAIRHARMVFFLRSQGWEMVDEYRHIQLWRSPPEPASHAERIEVTLPDSDRFDDYPTRLWTVIEAVAAAHHQPLDLVIEDLTATEIDTQHVRLRTRLPSGTVQVPRAAKAMSAIYDLWLGAAMSVLSGERDYVQPTHKPTEARRYLAHAYIGPSRAGSYIISVHAPLVLPPDPQEQLPLFEFDQPTPFGRRVSMLLHESLEAAHTTALRVAADEAEIDEFEPLVDLGVTSNLCDALVDLSGEADDQYGCDISFSWSAREPVNTPTPLLAFAPQSAETFKRASEHLRTAEEWPSTTLRGAIVQLERAATSGPGEIIIETQLPGIRRGRNRRVRVSLTENDYVLATQIHAARRPVVVTGNLTRRGNRFHLQNAHQFNGL